MVKIHASRGSVLKYAKQKSKEYKGVLLMHEGERMIVRNGRVYKKNIDFEDVQVIISDDWEKNAHTINPLLLIAVIKIIKLKKC
jgi:hypothetical protein